MNLFDHKLYQEDIHKVIDTNIDWTSFKGRSFLITGASGMIGRILCDILDSANNIFSLNLNIYLLSRNLKNVREEIEARQTLTKFYFIEHDIKNILLDKIKFDYIINAASSTHPLQYATAPIDTIMTNVLGTYNMLNTARENPGCRFILLSSVEVYGQNDSIKSFSETDFGIIDCNTLRANYCEAKRISETLCQAFKEQYNIDFVTLRLCRSYGPTLKTDDSKVLSQFIHKAIQKKDIILKSSGTQLFSYIYAFDAAFAIFLAIQKGLTGNAYNVADEKSNIMLKDLANLIAEISNTTVIFDLPSETESKGFSKATCAVLDSSKIKSLGWYALYDIQKGIQRTISTIASLVNN